MSPLPRFHRLDPKKREAILRAAVETFAEHGYEEASYNQIIEKAGISKGAMYYYFDDKMDLFLTVLRHTAEEVLSLFGTLPEVQTKEEFWSSMLDMSHKAIKYAAEHPYTLALQRTIFKLPPNLLSEVAPDIASISHSIWMQYLEVGQHLGAVRTDVPTDLLVVCLQALDSAVDRWMVHTLDRPSSEEYRHWIGIMLDMVRRMLEPASG
ncbi:MAG: TetR/AcrR family transcriptional regulator [Bradymonadales bacterium]|nr:TetR/AcrR family transcriptional regulator [Bradymonadales bacterium]